MTQLRKPLAALFIAAAAAVATLGGCAHKNTLIVEADRPPEAALNDPATTSPVAPATTMSTAATAPTSTPRPVETAAKDPAVAPPLPTPVTTGPATAPNTAVTAARAPGLYVAADADEATRFRNWRPVANYYPSGHAIAGPVYRINVPQPRSDRWDDVFAEDLFQTVMTIPQMFATPVWAIFNPPYSPVEYHGETVPPSYTVDDTLPYYVNENVSGIAQMKR